MMDNFEDIYDYYDEDIEPEEEDYYESNSYIDSSGSVVFSNDTLDDSDRNYSTEGDDRVETQTSSDTMSENNDSDSSSSNSTSSNGSNLNLSSLHDHPYIPRSNSAEPNAENNGSHVDPTNSNMETENSITRNIDDDIDLNNSLNSNDSNSSILMRPSVIVGMPSNIQSSSPSESPSSSPPPIDQPSSSLPLCSTTHSNKTTNVSPHADEPPAKCSRLDISQSDNDGQTCPICFEPWTTAGDHRMASLKCGHLFGYSCIMKWIRNMHNKVCPTCKAKSTARDIRFIYAKTLSCVDNSETEAVKAELEKVKEEKNKNALELHRLTINQEMYLKRIKDLETIIDEYKDNKGFSATSKKTNWRFHLEKNVEILKESGCRVFVHHRLSNSLYVSQINWNPLFPGYGIRQLDCESYKLNQFILLHSKEIRAISYSDYNNLIMTVSLDKDIKLSSPNREKQYVTVSTDLPLWSCCWDRDQPHRMYAGGIGGVIMQYDMRQTKTCLSKISPSGDMSPVVSVAPVSGGVISCQLNSVKVHKKNGGSFLSDLLPLEGPFQNLSFEPDTEQLIVSTRPNSSTPFCKHIVCNVDTLANRNSKCEIVHTFRGASKQTLMSKTSQFCIDHDFLFAAHSEDDRAVHIWNISSQKKMMSLTNQEQIIDTCPWKIGSDNFLATLSQNKAKIYKASYA